jgi:hypothetical protein
MSSTNGVNGYTIGVSGSNGINGHTNGVNGADGANGHQKSALVSGDEFASQDYDYVICGGGTAALAIAARLTENPDVTVGVIEAGKNRLGDPLIDTPALFLQMLGNKEYDYAWMTPPQVCSGSPCTSQKDADALCA